MDTVATKKTVLRLSTRNELSQHITTQHVSARYKDIGYGPDGKPVHAPSTSTVLEEAHPVSRVKVERDYDGNLFITLEE